MAYYRSHLPVKYRQGKSIYKHAKTSISKLSDPAEIQLYFDVYVKLTKRVIQRDFQNDRHTDAVKAVRDGRSIDDVAVETTEKIFKQILKEEEDKNSSGTWEAVLPVLKNAA